MFLLPPVPSVSRFCSVPRREHWEHGKTKGSWEVEPRKRTVERGENTGITKNWGNTACSHSTQHRYHRPFSPANMVLAPSNGYVMVRLHFQYSYALETGCRPCAQIMIKRLNMHMTSRQRVYNNRQKDKFQSHYLTCGCPTIHIFNT